MRAGKQIQWDGPRLKATGLPEARKFVPAAFRRGWVS